MRLGKSGDRIYSPFEKVVLVRWLTVHLVLDSRNELIKKMGEKLWFFFVFF